MSLKAVLLGALLLTMGEVLLPVKAQVWGSGGDKLSKKIDAILSNEDLRKAIVWLDVYNNQYNCYSSKNPEAKLNAENRQKALASITKGQTEMLYGRPETGIGFIESGLASLKGVEVTEAATASRPPLFSEVVPGVSRMGWPTLYQFQALRAGKRCDLTINLTGDCQKKLLNDKKREYCDFVRTLPEEEYREVAIGKPKTKQVRNRYFKAMRIITEARKQGKTVCFHCSLGVHRTGLLSMLLEKGRGETDRAILERYYRHANSNGCYHSALFPLLFRTLSRSVEFNKLKKEWAAINKTKK